MEIFLTIEETALRLRLKPETVRRQLRTGKLRGVKRGKWRVPESALLETPRLPAANNVAVQARQIMKSLRSRNGMVRNTAIITLTNSVPEVRAIVEAAAFKAAQTYYATPGGRSELADWRTLDGLPFHDETTHEGAQL